MVSSLSPTRHDPCTLACYSPHFLLSFCLSLFLFLFFQFSFHITIHQIKDTIEQILNVLSHEDEWFDVDFQINALRLKFDVAVVISISTARVSILEDFMTLANFLFANTTLDVEVEVTTKRWIYKPHHYIWEN